MWKANNWLRLAGLLGILFWQAGCETTELENQGTVTLAELQGQPPPPNTPPGEPPPDNGGGDDSDDGGDNGGGDDSGDGGDNGGDNGGSGGGGGDGGWPTEIDGPITWLHTDVSGWPVTARLNASVGGGQIRLDYDKARVWPAVDGVNANPWVIVKWKDGRWYAATFEWLRYGQTAKPMGVLDGRMGDHIKVSPLNQWRPRSGERIGFMVSGLARTKLRNVRERSNVDMVTWP